MEGALALTAADGRYEDRRKGLRDKGTARDVVADSVRRAQGLAVGDGAGRHQGISPRAHPRQIPRYRLRRTTDHSRILHGDRGQRRRLDARHRDLRSRRHRRRVRRARRPVRSRAKRPRTRIHGRLSRRPMPRSIDASCLRRRRTGRTSTVGAGRHSGPATWFRMSVRHGTSRPTSTSASWLCIG